jgi:hypothetical protein
MQPSVRPGENPAQSSQVLRLVRLRRARGPSLWQVAEPAPQEGTAAIRGGSSSRVHAISCLKSPKHFGQIRQTSSSPCLALGDCPGVADSSNLAQHARRSPGFPLLGSLYSLKRKTAPGVHWSAWIVQIVRHFSPNASPTGSRPPRAAPARYSPRATGPPFLPSPTSTSRFLHRSRRRWGTDRAFSSCSTAPAW